MIQGVPPKLKLAPGLPPEAYEMPGDLRNIVDWRARVWEGSGASRGSLSYVPPGQMAPVGYVMINPKDGTVVPIARPDEHHRGYDVLHDLARRAKFSFSPRDYTPVFAWPGATFYLYSPKEIPAALEVLAWFRDHGGPNVPVHARPQPGLVHQIILADDFLKARGQVVLQDDRLLPQGERVMRALDRLATLFGRPGSRGSRWQAQVFKAARTLVAVIKDNPDFYACANGALFRDDDVEERDWRAAMDRQIEVWEVAGNDAALEAAVFGFGEDWCGFKTSVHREIRRALDGNVWARELGALFGNLGLANDRLGRMGGPCVDPDEDVTVAMKGP